MMVEGYDHVLTFANTKQYEHGKTSAAPRVTAILHIAAVFIVPQTNKPRE